MVQLQKVNWDLFWSCKRRFCKKYITLLFTSPVLTCLMNQAFKQFKRCRRVRYSTSCFWISKILSKNAYLPHITWKQEGNRMPCFTMLKPVSLLSRPTSGPEFCVVWLRKRPASGWGSLWESSSFVPWLSTFVFRNVSGTVLECVRICWFRRNSSNLDRAPKMRDSVLLNSWDSFLVTLPSISSESCVIYSSLILGTDVFRDWPFLEFSSCVSLVTAANFRLFLNVAIFLMGKMLRSYEDWIILYSLINLRL